MTGVGDVTHTARELIAEARGATGSPSIGQMVPELCDATEALLSLLERTQEQLKGTEEQAWEAWNAERDGRVKAEAEVERLQRELDEARTRIHAANKVADAAWVGRVPGSPPEEE